MNDDFPCQMLSNCTEIRLVSVKLLYLNYRIVQTRRASVVFNPPLITTSMRIHIFLLIRNFAKHLVLNAAQFWTSFEHILVLKVPN